MRRRARNRSDEITGADGARFRVRRGDQVDGLNWLGQLGRSLLCGNLRRPSGHIDVLAVVRDVDACAILDG
jgi:hypothetical protein